MKHWIIKNRLYLMGAVTGAVAGFVYWKFVGCVTGTCSITSDPIRSTLYFALLGALLFGMFKTTPAKVPGSSSNEESQG